MDFLNSTLKRSIKSKIELETNQKKLRFKYVSKNVNFECLDKYHIKFLKNEEQVFNPNREPESADDFERLIASRPNSSLLWIKYIVFYLHMAEIEKARNVAQQALKTIMYKEEQERLNVWVALLNLENSYGTQASVDHVFNKATQNCDSYRVHCHMAEIYARSSKLQVKKN